MLSYATVLALALESVGGPDRCLTIKQIYQFFENHEEVIPATRKKNWKTSVRHTLSGHQCFSQITQNVRRHWKFHEAGLPRPTRLVLTQYREQFVHQHANWEQMQTFLQHVRDGIVKSSSNFSLDSAIAMSGAGSSSSLANAQLLPAHQNTQHDPSRQQQHPLHTQQQPQHHHHQPRQQQPLYDSAGQSYGMLERGQTFAGLRLSRVPEQEQAPPAPFLAPGLRTASEPLYLNASALNPLPSVPFPTSEPSMYPSAQASSLQSASVQTPSVQGPPDSESMHWRNIQEHLNARIAAMRHVEVTSAYAVQNTQQQQQADLRPSPLAPLRPPAEVTPLTSIQESVSLPNVSQYAAARQQAPSYLDSNAALVQLLTRSVSQDALQALVHRFENQFGGQGRL